MNQQKRFFCTCMIIGMTMFSLPGLTDDVSDFGTRIPETGELIKALQPKKMKYKAKGIGSSSPTKIAIRVLFTHNSADITDRSETILDNLAKAMQSSTLNKFNFDIEGHTDASGDSAYNLQLSKQRADAVRGYLIYRHHIVPKRLRSTGKGEAELLSTDDPTNAINRRVQIVNVGK